MLNQHSILLSHEVAPIQMQVVFAHDTPDSIIADITQSFGNQPAIPACKSLRRRFG
jgi:hypothetical protein